MPHQCPPPPGQHDLRHWFVFGGAVGTLLRDTAAGQLLRLSPAVDSNRAMFASIAGRASGLTVMVARERTLTSGQWLRCSTFECPSWMRVSAFNSYPAFTPGGLPAVTRSLSVPGLRLSSWSAVRSCGCCCPCSPRRWSAG